MRKTTPLALALALLYSGGAAAAARAQTLTAGGARALARSRQLVVVTTPAWDDVRGTLRRFERRGGKGPWSQAGAGVPVVVGRTGLGWGVGLFDAGAAAGPAKREGDGRAPAGVFGLGPAFGFDGSDEAGWVRLPYRPLTPATECVDDAASRHYNRIVERDKAGAVDWGSSERMRSVEGYRWGLVVAHNASPPAAGRGSCIFMHVWAGPDKGTAGCTAMERGNLESLLRWLDPRGRPLLVQLPEAEYARLRNAWRLPQTAR